ncbi:hypothetical protein COC42_01195 [Sphingomonas spermidinifaciens]|uniref:Fe-S oxidoreductase n=1 Tax=Sphingomonas spermidinifaciens TaxID=1141889 RepID=A0A2A4B5L0_9SPHN|nr:hypothetical protein [Sphingomonas spermidinifaciens]PCD03069.1 hypothetical protein COC42_01195 [Sphingomonas spermidinifaciens]
MKLIAMTAALALTGAAYAQQTPPADPGMTQPGVTQPDANTPPSDPNAPAATAPATDPAMQSAPTQTAPMAQQPMASTPTGATGGTETTGGYMPSTPPLSGTPTPGATVRVQPSMSPSQAFPPPAPEAEYPICKKGQTDNCRQRGG